jgi:hypothetical protein
MNLQQNYNDERRPTDRGDVDHKSKLSQIEILGGWKGRTTSDDQLNEGLIRISKHARYEYC